MVSQPSRPAFCCADAAKGTEVSQTEAARSEAQSTDEIDHDNHWEKVETAQSMSVALTALGAEFEQLRRQQAELFDSIAAMSGRADWNAAAEARQVAALDPILLRLHDLACAMARLGAVTSAEQRIKALALAEFCEEQSDDVVHRLASSLALDILRSS